MQCVYYQDYNIASILYVVVLQVSLGELCRICPPHYWLSVVRSDGIRVALAV